MGYGECLNGRREIRIVNFIINRDGALRRDVEDPGMSAGRERERRWEVYRYLLYHAWVCDRHRYISGFELLILRACPWCHRLLGRIGERYDACEGDEDQNKGEATLSVIVFVQSYPFQ